MDNKYNNKYNLSIVALLKNESHIIIEWLEHYLYHGVDHFYLINNDSSDAPESIADKYSKYITWLDFSGQGKQQQAYNAIFPLVKSRWVLVVDLDEFAYSPNGLSLLYILDQFKTFDSVGIPWMMYGSSGFIEQPKNVIENFTWRLKSDSPKNVLIKAAANMRHCRGFGVHRHLFKENANSILSNGQPVIGAGFADIFEAKLHKYELLINHYAIQSWEFFKKIKMTRGDSTYHNGKNPRDANYFKSYDFHDVEDLRLKEINKYVSTSI